MNKEFIFVPFQNRKDKKVLEGAVLAREQKKLLDMSDYLNCGLDLDTYMSLKDPDWPLG